MSNLKKTRRNGGLSLPRSTRRNGALSAQEPMARPFAAVATEVATSAAARSSAFRPKSAARTRFRDAAPFIISIDGTEAIRAVEKQELPRQKAPTYTILTSSTLDGAFTSSLVFHACHKMRPVESTVPWRNGLLIVVDISISR